MTDTTKSRNLTMLLVGDLILDEPDPDSFFGASRSVTPIPAGHRGSTRLPSR
jgi:hypothetical protein